MCRSEHFELQGLGLSPVSARCQSFSTHKSSVSSPAQWVLELPFSEVGSLSDGYEESEMQQHRAEWIVPNAHIQSWRILQRKEVPVEASFFMIPLHVTLVPLMTNAASPYSSSPHLCAP